MQNSKIVWSQPWQMASGELLVWMALTSCVLLFAACGRSWRGAGAADAPSRVVLLRENASEPQDLRARSGRLDVNAATEAELRMLPGIGVRRARAIVAERQKRGAFGSVWELAEVPGLTPALVSRLESLLRAAPSGR